MIVLVVVVSPRIRIEDYWRGGVATVECWLGRRIDARQPAAPAFGRGALVGDVNEEHSTDDDMLEHGHPPRMAIAI
jgi:hypothetical protein